MIGPSADHFCAETLRSTRPKQAMARHMVKLYWSGGILHNANSLADAINERRSGASELSPGWQVRHPLLGQGGPLDEQALAERPAAELARGRPDVIARVESEDVESRLAETRQSIPAGDLNHPTPQCQSGSA
jgi:hypothetical protein